MVETRSQRKKKLVEMAAGSQVGSSHETETLTLMEKIVWRMGAIETSWEKEVEFLTKERAANLKLREEFDELQTQYEYTDLMCTQLEIRVKEVEESRDQGLAKIVNLKKTLEDTRNELAVVKKVVGHNSGGGVPHKKIKEPESYDGTRKEKTLGNFLWDMEKYLEQLNLVDGETQVNVAT